MKLGKDISSNITHILDPVFINTYNYSFCGLVGQWRGIKWTGRYEFFDGEIESVNCGTCKVMANNHILRKLKGD